jgi:hypothetical protein
MTADEFLDGFCDKAGIPKSSRTPNGVKHHTFHRIAVECPENAYGHHYHDGFPCSGWVLEEPKPQDRGGVYSSKTHT